VEIGRHVELVATAYADDLSHAEISAITADRTRASSAADGLAAPAAFPVPGIDVRRTRDADATRV
jgi:hypothetical protein